MKKHGNNKQTKELAGRKSGRREMLSGVIMLVLTPLVFYLLGNLASIGCEKGLDNSCTITNGFSALLTALWLSAVYGLISLLVFVRGVIRRVRGV